MSKVPAPDREHQSVSVSIEKISNGFLKTTCRSGDGAYREVKEYCAKRPTVEVEARDVAPRRSQTVSAPKGRVNQALAELKRSR